MMKRNVFLIALVCAFANFSANAANVVARPTTTTQKPSRATNTSRMPTTTAKQMATVTTATATAVETPATTEPETKPETPTVTPVAEPDIIIENKSSQFSAALDKSLNTDTNAADTDLAKTIRAQRAALDAADNAAAVDATLNAARVSGKNACDTGLRECMTEKCGKNFTKCATDTDTMFGTKLDSCRRNLKCSAHEFKLFTAEIKADRNSAIKLKSFNDVIECGQTYDTCIINECGTTYSKCLGKSAGDLAISKCETIAKNCREMDSGLASRTMSVFATLRQNAEKQIATDEKKLYALRDQMKSVCTRLGAMFDERSLDCVYTVNFYAGDNSTLYSSKKAYAGATFDCTPNWFGIDITTFRENAYRETRAQTSASSAMLGSGVGTAVGAITSGAIDRAIDRKTAEDAAKKAECERDGNVWNSFLGTCTEDKSAENAEKKNERIQEREENKAERESKANTKSSDKKTKTATTGGSAASVISQVSNIVNQASGQDAAVAKQTPDQITSQVIANNPKISNALSTFAAAPAVAAPVAAAAVEQPDDQANIAAVAQPEPENVKPAAAEQPEPANDKPVVATEHPDVANVESNENKKPTKLAKQGATPKDDEVCAWGTDEQGECIYADTAYTCMGPNKAGTNFVNGKWPNLETNERGKCECPTNATESGHICVCNTGYARINDDTCESSRASSAIYEITGTGKTADEAWGNWNAKVNTYVNKKKCENRNAGVTIGPDCVGPSNSRQPNMDTAKGFANTCDFNEQEKLEFINDMRIMCGEWAEETETNGMYTVKTRPYKGPQN